MNTKLKLWSFSFWCDWWENDNIELKLFLFIQIRTKQDLKTRVEGNGRNIPPPPSIPEKDYTLYYSQSYGEERIEHSSKAPFVHAQAIWLLGGGWVYIY